jgi:hypothetical protein
MSAEPEETPTARERAETELALTRSGPGVFYGSLAGRRIGYALLDVADAIREHTAALKEIEQRRARS